MRRAALGLGFFLIASCNGSSETSDSGTGPSAAAAGDRAESGGSNSSGGGTKSSGGAAGTVEPSSGGSSTGGSSTGGVTQGGATQGGSSGQAGSAGESSGEGGEASGSGGSPIGTGGTAVAGGGSGGGGVGDPVCDPDTGELDNTTYPNCEPRDAQSSCELCIQAYCCAESKSCYGYDPGNVCGWGGPTKGDYAGLSEIDCYVQCARDYVAENLAYDDYTADVCVPACTTSECGLIGNATQDLVACLNANCEEDCFGP